MYVLKNPCSRCGGNVLVNYYKDEEGNKIVDCGECLYCGKIEILSQDEYDEFITRCCKYIRRTSHEHNR